MAPAKPPGNYLFELAEYDLKQYGITNPYETGQPDDAM